MTPEDVSRGQAGCGGQFFSAPLPVYHSPICCGRVARGLTARTTALLLDTALGVVGKNFPMQPCFLPRRDKFLFS